MTETKLGPQYKHLLIDIFDERKLKGELHTRTNGDDEARAVAGWVAGCRFAE